MSLLGSLRAELLFTICVRILCIVQEIVKDRKLLLLLFLAFANNDVKNDDTKTDTKQDLIDFDSWTNDRVISKPQDKTAIVKQGIQQLQVVSLEF